MKINTDSITTYQDTVVIDQETLEAWSEGTGEVSTFESLEQVQEFVSWAIKENIKVVLI